MLVDVYARFYKMRNLTSACAIGLVQTDRDHMRNTFSACGAYLRKIN